MSKGEIHIIQVHKSPPKGHPCYDCEYLGQCATDPQIFNYCPQMVLGKKVKLEVEMTDPVREEMMRRLRNHDSLVVALEDKFHAELGGRNVAAIRDEITQERQDFLTDLLRVIRGHMEGRWLNFEKDSREYKLVADYALHQTLESLPEEVKSGKGEQL